MSTIIIIVLALLFLIIMIYMGNKLPYRSEPTQKKCTRDDNKICPLWYTWDNNGSFHAGGHLGCCKIKEQIEAASKLGKN